MGSSAANVNRLGLIAGNGSFPLEVAEGARRRGIAIFAVAHLEETSPALEPLCEQLTWIRVGELEKMIAALKRAAVSQVAMAGGVSRARLKDSFAPDRRALAMIARIGKLSDDAVLRAVAGEIESEGIEMIDPVFLLERSLALAGRQAGPEPTAAQLRDLALAFSVARALGRFDIGQAVAVKDGAVAAVEAVEGTDAALRRAAAVAGRGLVVAKAAKPGQDLRFDRPAIGPDTIALLGETGAAVLGVEAGCTLILERPRTIELAQARAITVWGYE